MDEAVLKRLINRRKLLFQQLELSVLDEKEWLKIMSGKQIEAFRDSVLDEINEINRILNQKNKP